MAEAAQGTIFATCTTAHCSADESSFGTLIKQGAEAVSSCSSSLLSCLPIHRFKRIYQTTYFGQPCLVKERFSKRYRHPDLDAKLTSHRVLQVGFKSSSAIITRTPQQQLTHYYHNTGGPCHHPLSRNRHSCACHLLRRHKACANIHAASHRRRDCARLHFHTGC